MYHHDLYHVLSQHLTLQKLFYTNHIFISTFTLFLIGTLSTLFLRSLSLLRSFLRRYSLSSVTLSNHTEQELYNSFLIWLANNSTPMTTSDYEMKSFDDRKRRKNKSLYDADEYETDDDDYWLDQDGDDYDDGTMMDTSGKTRKNDEKSVGLLPGANGTVAFWYRGHFMWCHRSVSANPLAIGHGGNSSMFVHETMYISTYGTDPDVIRQVLEEAHSMESYASSLSGGKNGENMKNLKKKEEKFLKVYTPSDMGFWVVAKRADHRSLDSVFLQNGLAQNLLNDVRKFLKSAHYYRRVAVPYRRGYMLYGEAGCGKSSVVSAIASELNMNIYYLSLNNFQGSDASLSSMIARVPPRSILLLEDVDAAFNMRNTTMSKRTSVTFSGLLNILDGVQSENGRILFMTTNHIENIDSALLRSGRSDVKCHFARANKYQISGLFHKFFKSGNGSSKSKLSDAELSRLLDELLDKIPEYSCSMAVLQGHFIKYVKDCAGAVKNYHEIFEAQKSYANNELVPTTGEGMLPQSHVSRIGDTITNWLIRLGLGKYLSLFMEHKIFTLADLDPLLANNPPSSIKIDPTSVCRIGAMVRGTKETKEGFENVTASQSRKLFLETFTNKIADDATIDVDRLATEFSEKVDGHNLSVFQVQDYLFEHRSSAKSAIEYTHVLTNNLYDHHDSQWSRTKQMSLKDWIHSTHCKCALPTDVKQKIVEALEKQDITTVEFLTALSESDLKEFFSPWAKTAHISSFMSAIEHVKFLETEATRSSS